MKKVATILALALFCLPVTANEEKTQGASSPWLKVGFDASMVLFGAYFAQGEFKLSDDISLIARLDYVDPRGSVKSDVNAIGGWGVGAALGARFYLRKDCMSGFFLQDYVEYNYSRFFTGLAVTTPAGPIGPDFNILTNFFNVGYSWVTGVGFFMEAVAGLQTSVVLSGGAVNPPRFKDMNSLETRINVGWTF
jgi:hypothetical protein